MEGRGTFSGAEVVPGHDWQAQNQGGGCISCAGSSFLVDTKGSIFLFPTGGSSVPGTVIAIQGKDGDMSVSEYMYISIAMLPHMHVHVSVYSDYINLETLTSNVEGVC